MCRDAFLLPYPLVTLICALAGLFCPITAAPSDLGRVVRKPGGVQQISNRQRPLKPACILKAVRAARAALPRQRLAPMQVAARSQRHGTAFAGRPSARLGTARFHPALPSMGYRRVHGVVVALCFGQGKMERV